MITKYNIGDKLYFRGHKVEIKRILICKYAEDFIVVTYDVALSDAVAYTDADEYKTHFIPEEELHDNFIDSLERINDLHKLKEVCDENGYILKIDIEKKN